MIAFNGDVVALVDDNVVLLFLKYVLLMRVPLLIISFLFFLFFISISCYYWLPFSFPVGDYFSRSLGGNGLIGKTTVLSMIIYRSYKFLSGR